MSWRDRYQPGSFRGVPFRTQEHEGSGGRRLETHEYPFRDVPWTEDLGRRARTLSLTFFVAGDDCLEAADRLEAAFDQGAGLLVHPWKGSMIVTAESWSRRDTTDDGGIVSFQVSFVEAGKAIQSVVRPDTGAIARTTAAAATVAARDRFADRFSIERSAAFVEKAAGDVVRYAAAATSIAAGLQGGIGPALAAIDANLGLLPAGLADTLRAPIALGRSLVDAVLTIRALGGSAAAQIAGLSRLAAFDGGLIAVPGATPDRLLQRANQAAVVDLVAVAAVAELVAAIADAPLASYQDAVALRDATVDLIEDRQLAAADIGDDAVADAYAELQRVMVADVTARGGTLARVYAYTPIATEPALVIAARLYGPTPALSDRVDDIIARNRIRHPGFVPGGCAIEVLEASSG